MQYAIRTSAAACQGAALYGANGFTGTMTFGSTGDTTVWDYICVHTPGAPAGTFMNP